MALADRTFVLGLTGPFGSGCSTVVNLLARLRPSFHPFKLSDVLRREWKDIEPAPTRTDLQGLGDALRQKHGTAFLAEQAVKDLESAEETFEGVALDGIRNTGEIDFLRTRFGDRFFLVAVYAPADVRWDRVRDAYVAQGLDEQEFLQDDKRDQNEEPTATKRLNHGRNDARDEPFDEPAASVRIPVAVRLSGTSAT